jgi:hypothetical protein
MSGMDFPPGNDQAPKAALVVYAMLIVLHIVRDYSTARSCSCGQEVHGIRLVLAGMWPLKTALRLPRLAYPIVSAPFRK